MFFFAFFGCYKEYFLKNGIINNKEIIYWIWWQKEPAFFILQLLLLIPFYLCHLRRFDLPFLWARTRRLQAGTESQNYVCLSVCVSAFISSSSSSSVSLEEGLSQTCVGAVPRDLSLYDIMSGIRCLLLHSNTVCCTILSVERCSLGNTSLHRDKMTPPLQEYSSVLYYTTLS